MLFNIYYVIYYINYIISFSAMEELSPCVIDLSLEVPPGRNALAVQHDAIQDPNTPCVVVITPKLYLKFFSAEELLAYLMTLASLFLPFKTLVALDIHGVADVPGRCLAGKLSDGTDLLRLVFPDASRCLISWMANAKEMFFDCVQECTEAIRKGDINLAIFTIFPKENRKLEDNWNSKANIIRMLQQVSEYTRVKFYDDGSDHIDSFVKLFSKIPSCSAVLVRKAPKKAESRSIIENLIADFISLDKPKMSKADKAGKAAHKTEVSEIAAKWFASKQAQLPDQAEAAATD
jgi:hypothetical protein